MKLYHITPTRNLKSILDKGLELRIGKRSKSLGGTIPAIFFFKSLSDCENALIKCRYLGNIRFIG